MSRIYHIGAFGALNEESYQAFSYHLAREAEQQGLTLKLRYAGPYPNKEAVTVPGRPLRGDALKDPALKEELYEAVAADAKALGEDIDLYCMPCMSMIGFHEGVEKALGKPILPLAAALKDFYQGVSRLGIIHMKPAAKRVDEIFEAKAVKPDDGLLKRLDEAEKKTKTERNPAYVEAVMADIVKNFRHNGLEYVLFARADAPKADQGPAGKIENIQINSYFDILASYICAHLAA